jgi:dephospho-CoA kinase
LTIVIGLTGGIGSGKSTIAQYLAELGAVVIDADKVGHEAFMPGTPAYRDVIDAFGKEVMTPTGEIDRKKLGQIVFDDTNARGRLNRIMWSRIWEMIDFRIDTLRKRNIGVVVVEAFGLIEAGWTSLMDQVWVAVVSESVVVERLKKQRNLAEGETLARIRSQLGVQERLRYADVVIDNDRKPEEVKARVRELWDKLQSGTGKTKPK